MCKSVYDYEIRLVSFETTENLIIILTIQFVDGLRVDCASSVRLHHDQRRQWGHQRILSTKRIGNHKINTQENIFPT